MNYLDMFENAVNKYSKSIALVDREGTRSISYEELNILTDKVSGKIIALGIPTGSFIMINMNRCMEYIAAALGVLKAGCAIVPMISEYPQERINLISADCDSPLTITEEFFADVDKYSPESRRVGEDDPAYVIYTSGSTGVPKGIVHSVHGMALAVERNKVLYHDLNQPRWTAVPKFSFIVSACEIYTQLAIGAAVHILSEETCMSLQGLTEYWKREHIDGSFVSPQVFRILSGDDFPLNHCLVGGEKLTNIKPSSSVVYNVYGMSETFGGACYCRVDSSYRDSQIGKAFEGLTVHILDADGKEVPLGEKGELCMEGEYGVKYLNNPELSKEKFEDLGDGRWKIHTGDIAYIDETGSVCYVSRMDWMVKVNGQRVDLGEVEKHLLGVAGIKNAAARAFEDKQGKTYIAGYYVLEEGKELTEDDIKETLKIKLPEYMIPRYLVKLDKMPLNNNGKLDRKSLAEPEAQDNKTGYEAPLNDTERIICESFEGLLGCGKVGRTDNFDALGGDSISKMRFVAEMGEKFGVANLTAADLMNDGTPAGIATVIEGKKSGSVNSTVRENVNPVNPMNVITTFCMLTLPFVHMVEEMSEANLPHQSADFFIWLILLIAEPIPFMLVMGYKFKFEDVSAKTILKNAISFFVISVFYDIARWLILGNLPGYLHLAPNWEYEFDEFLASDIYMFVGWFYLFFAFAKKIHLSDKIVLLIAVVLFVVSYILPVPYFGNYLDTIVGNFIVTGGNSYFPFDRWFLIVLLGYIFAMAQRHFENKTERKKEILFYVLCTLIAIGCFAFFEDSDDYDLPVLFMFGYTFATFAVAGVLKLVIKIVGSKNRLLQFMDKEAALLMPYYLIQGVVAVGAVSILAIIPGLEGFFKVPQLIVTGLLLIVLTFFLTNKFGTKLMAFLLGISEKISNKLEGNL